MFYQIIKKLKKISKSYYYNSLIRAGEYQIPKSKVTINPDSNNKKIFFNIDGVMVFRRGFLILHSSTNPQADNQTIDLIDIEGIEIKPETKKK